MGHHLASIDWILIGLYFAVIFGVAWWTAGRRRSTHESTTGYFLAGRNVGWFVVGAALFASNIGSEHLVGLAGTGYGSGVAVGQFEVLASLILLILGWLFVPFYLRSGVFTMPEFLERRYSSGARWYLAVISIVGYVLTKISVTLYAGGIVYQVLVGGDFWTGALIIVLATGLYTILGGLRAVLYTELLQMFMLVGGALVVTWVGLSEIGGWSALTASVDASFFDMWLPATHPDFPWTGILFGAPILGVWYWCTDQFIVQRVLSAKGVDPARRGTIFGGFLKLLPLFIFVLPGIVAKALESSGALAIDRADHALPEMIRVLLPAGIRGLVVAGFLAALMSSLAAVFNSCSTLITCDVYQKLRPDASERQLVWVGKISTGVLVAFGLLWIPFMQYISSQLYVYLQSVQAYISPPIAAVFLVGLFWRRVNAQGAIASLLTGFVLGAGRLIAELSKGSLHGALLWYASLNFLHFAILLFVVCTAVLVVVSLLTPAQSDEKLAGLTFATTPKGKDDGRTASDPAWRRRDVLLSIVLALCVGLVWWLFRGSSSAAPADPPAAEAPAATGKTTTAPVELKRFDQRANAILAEMTLAEKVGQMTQADISYIHDPADVTRYFLGSVLSGGGSDPAAGNSREAWRDMVLAYQRRALATRLHIPLLYGVDAVHGHSNVEGAVVFPHNIGLGATRDAALVEEVYRTTALEVRGTGIQWAFAPCVAVVQDIRWGRTYESFSEDPAVVSELGGAATRGLQGAGLGDPRGVAACAKHWVADGGTAMGTGALRDAVSDTVFDESGRPEGSAARWPLDQGDARIDEETLRRVHFPGYLSALREGVATIMPSFSSWNGVKVSGHRYLLTEVLKQELGFDGFLISDWGALDGIPGDYASDVETSINAGMDMVMVPDKYPEFIATLTRLAESGRVPMERIDDAVRRILRIKLAMGLLDEGWTPEADPALTASIGSAEHRALARRAVAESLVVLKNDGGVLPLSPDLGRIHVVGRNADDLGNQCGGWTIQWQGASGPITEGTTILEAVRSAAGKTEITHAADGRGAEGADLVLAVVGETPYAEMLGDRTDLRLNAADVASVKKAAAAGAPVVLVVVSGRPLVLSEVLGDVDAVVAAWWPGTEGDGVADVLFGRQAPVGKLPFTWPRSNEQLEAAGGQAGIADPQYPLGHGLTWPQGP